MQKRKAFNLSPLENTKYLYLLARADHWHALHTSERQKGLFSTQKKRVSLETAKESYHDDFFVCGFTNR
jgi:hypothetical protein